MKIGVENTDGNVHRGAIQAPLRNPNDKSAVTQRPEPILTIRVVQAKQSIVPERCGLSHFLADLGKDRENPEAKFLLVGYEWFRAAVLQFSSFFRSARP